MVLKVMLEQ
jgi:hypothetical protein